MKNPFAVGNATADQRLGNFGENRLISKLQQWLGPATPPTPEGIGDDCAVFRPAAGVKQLMTTDCVTYGRHFDATIEAAQVGAKLIKRNLSDIAAMGGRPGPALLTLLCGSDVSITWLEEFVGGIRQSCLDYDVSLVGGDLSQLPAGQFTATLALTGCISTRPVLRSSARIGDLICVTGTLGGSLIGKHHTFEPRLKEGQWLAQQDACTAMMDLSDGLGKDLAAILPPGSSAAIDLQQLPISPAARKCAVADSLAAEQHAFCDGEDYELLFTISGETDFEDFSMKWREQFPDLRLSCLGRIQTSHPAGRYINAATQNALPWQAGFEHFKN